MPPHTPSDSRAAIAYARQGCSSGHQPHASTAASCRAASAGDFRVAHQSSGSAAHAGRPGNSPRTPAWSSNHSPTAPARGTHEGHTGTFRCGLPAAVSTVALTSTTWEPS